MRVNEGSSNRVDPAMPHCTFMFGEIRACKAKKLSTRSTWIRGHVDDLDRAVGKSSRK